MTYPDRVFMSICNLLIKDGVSDEGQNIRAHYADGEPATTSFITQVFERYDISKNQFPVGTHRRVAWKSAIKELLWMYQDQSSDLEVLRYKYGITWWDAWSIGDGTIGQRYGATVARYGLIDKLISDLKTMPYSRRHIVNLWQNADLAELGGLDPCAFQTMWSVRGEYLDCTLTIRSNDYLVAGFIDRIQYVALMMMIAKATGLKPGYFAVLTQNMHYYHRHADALYDLMHRTPSEIQPILKFEPDTTDFYSFTLDDFEMLDYHPVKPQLKFELAI
jgi:thymidylate synthase